VYKGTCNRCVKINEKIPIRLGENVRKPQGGFFLTDTVVVYMVMLGLNWRRNKTIDNGDGNGITIG